MTLRPSVFPLHPIALALLWLPPACCGQSQPPAPSETVAKVLSPKAAKRREKALRKEMNSPYRRWIDEDVRYIITDEERTAWNRLSTDDEREQFVEQFWLRRDPTPDTVENEYKEEHYRRIAYANERFGSGMPGWRTDRGRIYIMHGPPGEIEPHASGGSYQRPPEEGGGTTSTYRFEIWRYRYLEGVGNDVVLEFVDRTMTGEFRLTIDPEEKNALANVPGGQNTAANSLLPQGTRSSTTTSAINRNPFDALIRNYQVLKPPPLKFHDLEPMVDSIVRYNVLPMQVRVDYVPLVGSTCLTGVTLRFDKRDLQFQDKDGVSRAAVRVLMRVTTLTRRLVNVDEQTVTVEVPTEMLSQATAASSNVYQKVFPLAPGTYRLQVVAKDTVSGNAAVFWTPLSVPGLEDDKLAASTLILADQIEKVPTRSVGAGQFVIGGSKVRPRVGDTFHRNEKLGLYLKLYNLQPDEKTRKPNGTLQYQIFRTDSDRPMLDYTEDLADIAGASSSQITVEKLLALSWFDPGRYQLRIKVVDRNRGQTLMPAADFTVEE